MAEYIHMERLSDACYELYKESPLDDGVTATWDGRRWKTPQSAAGEIRKRGGIPWAYGRDLPDNYIYADEDRVVYY